ncbi:hypothetical protein [Nocardia abscessus]|uniref:hypothetical protein n=1 Tax=Nocardia abscessus TaxID=120957 RepID=UPI0024543E01|nr:hypothetical protein [Nocardia abscessus]
MPDTDMTAAVRNQPNLALIRFIAVPFVRKGIAALCIRFDASRVVDRCRKLLPTIGVQVPLATRVETLARSQRPAAVPWS